MTLKTQATRIQLTEFPGMDQVLLALESFPARAHVDSMNPGQRPCVRLTVSHPDPDRHIAIVMGDLETWALFRALGDAYQATFGIPVGVVEVGADGEVFYRETGRKVPPGGVGGL